MSTLKVTNIQKTGETASRDVSGVAAARVDFNPYSTLVVNESTNVSSVADNGVGLYSASIVSSMASRRYTLSGHCGDISFTMGQQLMFVGSNIAPTYPNTNSFGVKGLNGSSTVLLDPSVVSCVAHGDLS